MEYLQENKIRVYRTDESGSVKIIIDGKSFLSDTSRDDYKSGKEIMEEEQSN